MLGVDTGFKGALALIAPQFFIEAWIPMPVKGKGKRREVDVGALSFWLDLYHDRIALSVLERAITVTGQGLRSTARSWEGRGDVRGCLIAKGCGKLFEPEPATWTNDMGVGSDKARHCRLAEKFFPAIAPLITFGPRGGLRMNDGLADASLLGAYALKIMRGFVRG